SGTVPEHDLIRAMRSGARDYIQNGHPNPLAPPPRPEHTARRARPPAPAARRGVPQAPRARRGAETHRRREEYFGFVIDNTSDVILLLDARLSIVFESPAMQRMLGYARED